MKVIRYSVTKDVVFSALVLFLKKPSKFSFYQFLYVSCRYINMWPFPVWADLLMIKTLRNFVRLRLLKNSIEIGSMIFSQMDNDFVDNLVGMYIDIVIKDKFYKTDITSKDYNDILFYYYQEGPYEVDFVNINAGDIVIDAGANIGVFSLLAAQKGAKVYAFEPQQIFFNLLCNNIKLNNLSNFISCSQYALSEKSRKACLFIDKTNLLASSLNIKRSDNSIIVKCITLDEWVNINNISRVDFIKADIEGAERLLLSGAKQVIRKFKPRLAISAYHFSDDMVVLEKLIHDICNDYIIIKSKKILYAYVK
ncbi:MAG: FkbM family methyltransferase [Firmicutes bacterium]|nr:FkbM family methyltransferase [Candidatus Alectryobacillus merdavium]